MYIVFHDHRKLVLSVCMFVVGASCCIAFVTYAVLMSNKRENIAPSAEEMQDIVGDVPDDYCANAGTVRRVLNVCTRSTTPAPALHV